MANQQTSPLEPLVNGWINKIRHAETIKKEEFGDDAAECMKFYHGPYTWLYQKKKEGGRPSEMDYDPDGEDELPTPTFQMTVNKAAEVVQLFGPVMYQRNPDRRVTPRRTFVPPIEYFGPPDDPNTQMIWQQVAIKSQAERGRDLARSMLLENYLNYTPLENDLRKESRLAVDEGLIKGMGCGWCEIVEMPDGLKVVGTFFDSCDNYLVDPDAKREEDATWIARKCCHPVWAVEREYNLPPGTLKGNMESASRQAETQGDQDENARRARGGTNDLIVYYKIWSKMGLGSRLKDVMTSQSEWRSVIDSLGDYCFIAVANGCQFPLNLGPDVVDKGDMEQVQEAIQWPIPFWLDRGQWPVTPLVFHAIPNRLWPMSHLKPALGELKFINWMYSFLASKIRVASRDFLVLAKALANEAKTAIKHGGDYTVIEISQLTDDIDKMVKFIQHPTFNPDIYRVLEHMMSLFDKRTGLTDIAYGQTDVQLRSAEEARVKNQNAAVRPADMAQQVEEWSSLCARKEMAAARWVLSDADVRPVLGEIGAAMWKAEILSTNPAELFHQFDCRVESGSSKRPDRERDRDNLGNAMNNLFTPLYQYAAQSGDVGPANALIGDWAKSNGMDAEKYLLKPPPPPQPVSPAGGGPPPTAQPGAK